jgi:hypothetical protein
MWDKVLAFEHFIICVIDSRKLQMIRVMNDYIRSINNKIFHSLNCTAPK